MVFYWHFYYYSHSITNATSLSRFFDANGYYIPQYNYQPTLQLNQQINLKQSIKTTTNVKVRVNVPAPKVNINIEQPDYGLWGPGSWLKVAMMSREKSYDCLKNNNCGFEVWGNTDTLKKTGSTAIINIKIACLNNNKKRWFCAGNPEDHSGGRPLRFNCAANTIWDSNTSKWITLNKTMQTVHSFVCTS